MPTRALTASDRKVLRDEIKEYLNTYPMFNNRGISTDNNSLVYENIFPKQDPFVSLGTTIRNRYIWTYIRTTVGNEDFFSELEEIGRASCRERVYTKV